MVYQNQLALFLPSMTKINDFIRIKKSRLPGAREKWRDRRFVQSRKSALRGIKEKKMNFKAWNVKIFEPDHVSFRPQRDQLPVILPGSG